MTILEHHDQVVAAVCATLMICAVAGLVKELISQLFGG